MEETTVYEEPPRRPARRLGRKLAVLGGIAVLVLVAVVAGIAIGSRDEPAPAPGPTAGPSAANVPETGQPPASGGSSPAPATAPPATAFAYQPVWPFANAAEAAAWQQSYRTGGTQPWHLDPRQTALSFASGYLGFAEIDRVTSRTLASGDAWVGVGFRLPDGRPTTAAVVHLARLGTGADAPWEVVGTRDTTLTLTTPAYGSTVSSPLVVGGRISGVDEGLRVQVRSLGRGLVGSVDGIPAGGERSPWSASVRFAAPVGTVLTVVVSTGGHVEEVERFAITAVRFGPPG